jgi:hypothetical protein
LRNQTLTLYSFVPFLHFTLTGTQLCKTQKHTLTRTEATKRFFKCANCHYSHTTLNKVMPTLNCPRCGQSDWTSASMLRGKRTAAAAGSELALDHAPGKGGGRNGGSGSGGGGVSRHFGETFGDTGPTSAYVD